MNRRSQTSTNISVPAAKKCQKVEIRDNPTPGPSKFVIPRKKHDTNLFQQISLESREFQMDIWPILSRQCLRPPPLHQSSKFRYTKCTLVNNEMLLNKFEEKRREMKQEKSDVSVSYGFWHTFSLDEVNSVCKNGLASNYSLGTLGRPDLGVYISQHSDVLTAAPLLDGIAGTLVVFKIMKGRSKLVPVYKSGHLEPTPNYDCHAPKMEQISTMVELTPYQTFENGLLYLYDYLDVDPQVPPRNVCPIAVIEYVYEDRNNSPHWLRSELLAWTGNLRFDGQNEDYETGLRLVSHLAKMKPPYLGPHILVKIFAETGKCIEWAPIEELRAGKMQGLIYAQRRDIRLHSGYYASVFRLIQGKQTEKYAQLMGNMYKNDVVGLTSLRDGTMILVFPVSHFACQLGIPAFRDAKCALYCLVLGFRSLVTGTGYIRDPYEGSVYDVKPSEHYIANSRRALGVAQEYSARYPAQVAYEYARQETATTWSTNSTHRASSATSPGNSVTTASTDRASTAIHIPPMPDSINSAKDIRKDQSGKVLSGRPLLRDPRLQKWMNAGDECQKDVKPPTIIKRDIQSQVRHGNDGRQIGSTGAIRVEMKTEVATSPPLNVEEKPVTKSTTATGPDTSTRTHTSSQCVALPAAESPPNIFNSDLLSVIYGAQKNAKAPVAAAATAEPEEEEEASTSHASHDAPFKAETTSELNEINPLDVELDKKGNIVNKVNTPSRSTSTMGFLGVVVPDDLVLTRADPAMVRRLLETFQLWEERNVATWRIKLHSQVVLKLAHMKKNLSSMSLQHKRATDILTMFHSYRQTGIVDLLQEHECDKTSRAAAEYLPCLQRLKRQFDVPFFIMLSNLSPESEVAKGFKEAGIRVMSLQALTEFMNI